MIFSTCSDSINEVLVIALFPLCPLVFSLLQDKSLSYPSPQAICFLLVLDLFYDTSIYYNMVCLTDPYRFTDRLSVRYVPTYQYIVWWGIPTNQYVLSIPIPYWTGRYCPYRAVCHGTVNLTLQDHPLKLVFSIITYIHVCLILTSRNHVLVLSLASIL